MTALPLTALPAAESAPARLVRQYASLLLALVTLAGFALRLPLLMRFPLREDEAIYGYWALHAWYVDPFFLQVWPDKPPIFLWLLSAALQLWGHGPETANAAARLANIMAGTLTIPVLAGCAKRWWGPGAALAAGLLVALSPFGISFAPTAFTDPLLVLAGSLALLLAARRRWFWSGLWLGIAIMTKQQGLLFVPLIAACALWEQHQDARRAPICALRFLGGLALIVLPILYWDSLRWTVAPSPWDLGATNAGGLTLLPFANTLERLRGWSELLWYLLAAPWAWAAYALFLIYAVTVARRRRAPAASWLPALLLAVWAGGFLVFHLITSVQVWDRYLLPLTIPLALLGGWGVSQWGYKIGQGVPLLVILLLLAAPAADAAQGGLPIGGDHGAYAGLDAALAAVDMPHALLFHRELGWHARFALFDEIRKGDVELRYFPSTVYLADSATKSPHKRRFVIVPDWAPLADLPMQLAVRRLEAQLYLRSGHFAVYRIDELPTPDASWRVCSTTPFHIDKLR